MIIRYVHHICPSYMIVIYDACVRWSVIIGVGGSWVSSCLGVYWVCLGCPGALPISSLFGSLLCTEPAGARCTFWQIPPASQQSGRSHAGLHLQCLQQTATRQSWPRGTCRCDTKVDQWTKNFSPGGCIWIHSWCHGHMAAQTTICITTFLYKYIIVWLYMYIISYI